MNTESEQGIRKVFLPQCWGTRLGDRVSSTTWEGTLGQKTLARLGRGAQHQTTQPTLRVAQVVPHDVHRLRCQFRRLFRRHSREESHLDQADKPRIFLAQAL